MNNIFEVMKNLNNRKRLLGMAKIDKRSYNIPVSIWIDEAGSKRNTKHNFERAKIINNYNEDSKNSIPVYFDDGKLNIKKKWKINISESDLNKCLEFMEKNLDIFIKRWNDEIATDEMFDELNKDKSNRKRK